LAFALATGIGAAVIWALFAGYSAGGSVVRNFAPLAGPYSVRRKLSAAPEPETLTITVRGNVLEVVALNVPGAQSVGGEIQMSDQLPRSGKGHYEHVELDGTQLWGFWDVQVKDAKTILVHTTFVDQPNHRAVVTGDLWTRQGSDATS
jgi:hypothetical protein